MSTTRTPHALDYGSYHYFAVTLFSDSSLEDIISNLPHKIEYVGQIGELKDAVLVKCEKSDVDIEETRRTLKTIPGVENVEHQLIEHRAVDNIPTRQPKISHEELTRTADNNVFFFFCTEKSRIGSAHNTLYQKFVVNLFPLGLFVSESTVTSDTILLRIYDGYLQRAWNLVPSGETFVWL
ncbi:440_t:CDS:2 [Paraglomus occultum]|uniref:440_t:CDS:1 n=1 Tax=Paraglomus occultum TaxID=144539 RepID=A0A9N8VKL5_9GLOM|nr:440_t:CDS:2 [Paraglomus occultum]